MRRMIRPTPTFTLRQPPRRPGRRRRRVHDHRPDRDHNARRVKPTLTIRRRVGAVVTGPVTPADLLPSVTVFSIDCSVDGGGCACVRVANDTSVIVNGTIRTTFTEPDCSDTTTAPRRDAAITQPRGHVVARIPDATPHGAAARKPRPAATLRPRGQRFHAHPELERQLPPRDQLCIHARTIPMQAGTLADPTNQIAAGPSAGQTAPRSASTTCARPTPDTTPCPSAPNSCGRTAARCR